MTEPLWTDDMLRQRYINAFERHPDVHEWAMLCWIRDDYEARLAALEQAPAAMECVPDDVHSLLTELVTERLADIAITPGYGDIPPGETEKALAWLEAQRPATAQEDAS